MNTPQQTDQFASFYETTKDSVFRAVLLARAGQAEAAEDAVAEAYERAFLCWEKLAAHPNPTAWVIRTAINHRISMWRRHGRNTPEVTRSISLQTEGMDPALLQLIRELPKGQREVLALRVLLDFSTEQTAEALGVKQGTVKQLHRALHALRLHLVTNEAKEVWQ